MTGTPSHPRRAGWLAGTLLLAATLASLPTVLPLLRPAPGELAAMHWLILRDSTLPRIAVSLLAGGALALCGTLFQQVLRNPLAEPATLGVSGGAYLAVAAAGSWAPALLDHAREGVALAGAGLAVATVFGLAWRRGLAPGAVILAGLVIGLYCSALAAGLALLNGAGFQGLFLWASGSLAQNGWGTALRLAVELLVGAGLAAWLARPLGLLDLGEGQAAALGMPVRTVQGLALVLATGLSAAVTAALGIIGFVGLAAPALTRMTGARRLGTRLVLAPLIGAALLCLADGLVQAAASGRNFPTGAAVAAVGAPLLLWLLPGVRLTTQPLAATPVARRLVRPLPWMLAGLGALLLAMALSLSVGRGLHGWEWQGWHAMQPLLIWRLPRMLVAMAAGVMLATAGTIIQRLTSNPLASPEVLGVSSGAALGVILSLIFLPGIHMPVQMAAAVLGSAAALVALLLLSRRAGYAPDRMLLGGVALALMLGGIAAAFLSSGDPRTLLVAQWLSGTTYLATPGLAAAAWGVTLPAGLAAALGWRWLLVLPLGDPAARGLGLRLGLVRGLLLLTAALLTAAATLIVGPLTFIGLLAPHAARLVGLVRPLPQLAGAALLAALVMVLADWLGRILLFPAQLPAGLAATLLATPYVLFQMRRR